MHKKSKFMIGAIVGSTIGAITTLLFSTAEGKKVQKKLMKKFNAMDARTGHFGAIRLLAAAKKRVAKSLRPNRARRRRKAAK